MHFHKKQMQAGPTPVCFPMLLCGDGGGGNVVWHLDFPASSVHRLVGFRYTALVSVVVQPPYRHATHPWHS